METDIQAEKFCKDCELVKVAAEFPRCKQLKGGLSTYCRPCSSRRRLEWRKANPERDKAASRRKFVKHGERILAKKRAQYAADPETHRAAAARYRAANVEWHRERARNYMASNPGQRERASANTRAWVAANPHKEREYSRRRGLKRRANPANRLIDRLRSAMWKYMNGGKGGRRWFEVLGYSGDELCAHIERQFTRGMSWENMGEWHLDHIIPLSKFPASSPEDPNFKRVWALTNLRPLWAKDNLSKGAKVATLL